MGGVLIVYILFHCAFLHLIPYWIWSFCAECEPQQWEPNVATDPGRRHYCWPCPWLWLDCIYPWRPHLYPCWVGISLLHPLLGGAAKYSHLGEQKCWNTCTIWWFNFYSVILYYIMEAPRMLCFMLLNKSIIWHNIMCAIFYQQRGLWGSKLWAYCCNL